MLGELGTGAGGTGSPHAGEPVARRRGNRPLGPPDPISLPDCKNPKASLVGEKLEEQTGTQITSEHFIQKNHSEKKNDGK